MPWLNKERLIKGGSPDQLLVNPKSVIVVGVNYKKNNSEIYRSTDTNGKIAMYAQWEDYHLIIKKMLKEYKAILQEELAIEMDGRIFVDDGSLLEKGFAEKAGLGWFGKHTNIINPIYGSWIFLGALVTDLELTPDKAVKKNCGKCELCIIGCPTNAIVSPYQLDANKCISYLTIEFKGSIPIEYRKPIGNRIYGCDDCQLVCPWNKYGKITKEKDFNTRHNLDNLTLIDSFKISEKEFRIIFNGSAILRIGYNQWLRNIAISLGNSPKSDKIIKVLYSRLKDTNKLVQEHILWAIKQHQS